MQYHMFRPLGLLVLIILSCCTNKTMEQKNLRKDPHSYTDPAVARVKHLRWTATVNFEAKMIIAVASWDIEAEEDADSIILDTKDLIIHNVTLNDNQPAEFTLTGKDANLGQGLAIRISPSTKRINIHYQ